MSKTTRRRLESLHRRSDDAHKAYSAAAVSASGRQPSVESPTDETAERHGIAQAEQVRTPAPDVAVSRGGRDGIVPGKVDRLESRDSSFTGVGPRWRSLGTLAAGRCALVLQRLRRGASARQAYKADLQEWENEGGNAAPSEPKRSGAIRAVNP